MRNKILFIIIILAIIGISLPIILDNGGKSKKETEEELLISISEVRNSATKDIEEGKEKFSNLNLTNVSPIITSMDSLNLFKAEYTYNYNDSTDSLAIFNKQVELIKYYLGDDIDLAIICDGGNGNTYEENLIQMKSGTYKSHFNNMPSTSYCIQKDIYRYADIDPGFSNVWIDKGKIYSMSAKNSVVPEWNLEFVKSYYIADKSVNLDDEYNLLNGTMSVRDGIKFVEDYINNKISYIDSSKVKLVVDTVNVLKLTDTSYVFYYYITRSYNDVSFMWGKNGNRLNINKYYTDITALAMCDVDDVDFYYGMGLTNNKYEDVGVKIDKIVSVKKVLSIVSDKIGLNSVYSVKKLKLIYRLDNIGTRDDFKYNGNLYWLLCGTNGQDNRITYFYVNALTGELSYDFD